MYNFTIKEDGTGLDIIVTRAMFALAGIASLLYHPDRYFFINVIAAVGLLLAAVFIKPLLVRLGNQKMLLVACASLLLFIATRSIPFAIILLVYGYLVKFLNRPPVIVINTDGVLLKKLLSSPAHKWDEFNNIVLKDCLLTMDFKSNTLVQVTVLENNGPVDEQAFNLYCQGFID